MTIIDDHFNLFFDRLAIKQRSLLFFSHGHDMRGRDTYAGVLNDDGHRQLGLSRGGPIAVQAVERGMQYAYRDRRKRKSDFRGLWIQRINAGVRLYGMTYSQFISGLKKSSVEIDRKILAELAVNQPDTFKALVEKAQSAN